MPANTCEVGIEVACSAVRLTVALELPVAPLCSRLSVRLIISNSINGHNLYSSVVVVRVHMRACITSHVRIA